MKKTSLKKLLFLPALIVIISFLSCNDEPPPPMQYQAEYIFPDPMGCIPIVVCPNAGNNCANVDPHPPGLRTDQVAMLATFYRMSENDSASYFFDNYDWREMFPELDDREEMVGRIITGEYKVKMMGDSSVVIVSDEAINSANIVFAYNLNREMPCY